MKIKLIIITTDLKAINENLLNNYTSIEIERPTIENRKVFLEEYLGLNEENWDKLIE